MDNNAVVTNQLYKLERDWMELKEEEHYASGVHLENIRLQLHNNVELTKRLEKQLPDWPR